MSFVYKNVVVTLNNYQSVFKGYPPDILDEVRSAILDDTDISNYVKVCGFDSYKLNQLRLAIREFAPPKYINPNLSATCLYLIRDCISSGVSLSSLDKYMPANDYCTIGNDNLEKVLRATIAGADTRKIDFNVVPNDIISIICEGLVKGYPMWLITKSKYALSVRVIRLLMKAMQLQLDIHPFVQEEWKEGQITLLLAYSNKVDLNILLENVNAMFSEEQLSEVIDAYLKGVNFTLLCQIDSDKVPVFNEYQMNVLTECMVDKLDLVDIYNPMLSDMEMEQKRQQMLADIEKERSKELGGTLRSPNRKG